MIKSKKTVAVILCIAVLVSCFFVFTGCSSKGNQVQKFDALYQKTVKFSDIDEDTRYSYVCIVMENNSFYKIDPSEKVGIK